MRLEQDSRGYDKIRTVRDVLLIHSQIDRLTYNEITLKIEIY